MSNSQKNKYIYLDENDITHECKNSAEHDRLWRDRYLSASGLNYQALIETKNKVVTVQIHPGKYDDDKISSDNTVETEAVFLSVLIKDVFVALKDNGDRLEVEFETEAFKVPIAKWRSKPLQIVDALNVHWIGGTIWYEDIWESRALDDDRPGKGVTCQPLFRVFCTSASEFDPWASDNYRINISIILPNGQVIGDLDPEDPE